MKFNDTGGFVVGTHKHFSWEYKKSVFRGTQEVSTLRQREELINHNLCLFA